MFLLSYCLRPYLEVTEGEFAGEKGGGLEHGVTTPFGVGCGISDTNSYIRFNNDCNRYGIDALVIHYQRINTLADATGICKFATKSLLQAVGIEDMLDFYTAVTGKEMDLTHFIRAADRIYGLERHMHAQESITRKDDLPIGKWINEPIQNGPFKGERIDLKSSP